MSKNLIKNIQALTVYDVRPDVAGIAGCLP